MTRPWTDDAACLGHDPEWWYAGRHGLARTAEETKALGICRGCPVVLDCARDARHHEAGSRWVWGIWAGLTPRERRAAMKGRAA